METVSTQFVLAVRLMYCLPEPSTVHCLHVYIYICTNQWIYVAKLSHIFVLKLDICNYCTRSGLLLYLYWFLLVLMYFIPIFYVSNYETAVVQWIPKIIWETIMIVIQNLLPWKWNLLGERDLSCTAVPIH